ncbi:restriction endonuclease subunit S [Allobaculum fili]|uniref:restriction endonuclease subunit S n=1 Tax=Allobaculum fili TaxID=2834460 RepID=UPI001E306CB9|nr:restriction endonuclease subunit S [Allobaculum fili]
MIIKLDEVIKDIAAGPFGSNLKVECFTSSGFPIVDGANLKGVKVTDNITKFVSEEKARSLSRSIAKKGDVVVTISGTVGQIAYIPKDSKYNEYLVSQRQFRVSFDEDQVYVPYLVYYFHTREGQSKILAFKNQTGVPALAQPLKNFKNIEIDLPSLEFQKKQINLIERMQAKIDLNNQINKNLEQQIQEIFRSRFLTPGPSRDGWKKTTLADVSLIGAGGDKPKTVSAVQTTEYPYPIYSNGIRDEGLYGFSSGYKIEDESITVSARGTIGYVCLRHRPYTPIVRLITLVPKKEIVSAKYLYLWLRNSKILGTGTTQQQLTVPDFQKTEIVVPTAEEMNSFTDVVSPLFETIWANQAENLKLANLRDILLPKLFSGELDISNIEL